jgi:hypothetical protein
MGKRKVTKQQIQAAEKGMAKAAKRQARDDAYRAALGLAKGATPDDLPSPDEYLRKMAHVDQEFVDARRYLSALCAEDNQALGALMAEIHQSGRAMKVLAAMAVQALDFAHLSADRLGGDVQPAPGRRRVQRLVLLHQLNVRQPRSMPAPSNIPSGAAKSFCMSLTTTAACRRSTPTGDGLAATSITPLIPDRERMPIRHHS